MIKPKNKGFIGGIFQDQSWSGGRSGGASQRTKQAME